MKISAIIFFVSFLLIFSNAMAKFDPPRAAKKPVTTNIHNFVFVDDYQYLEDKNNPETLEWSKKSHNYTKEFIRTHYPKVEGLSTEISNYLDRDIRSAPFYRKGREFFWLKKKGWQQNKLYTVIKGKEILIFDPMKFDPSGLSSPTGIEFNNDASMAAIGLQYKGNEINTYRIIDTKTGKVVSGPLENVYSFGWTKDEKYAYITLRSKEIIEKQIPLPTYLHKISDGNNYTNSKLLGAPKDAKDFFSVYDDEESDLTIFSEGDFYTNTLKIRKQGTMDQPIVAFTSDKYRASIGIKNGFLFYYTNENAPNFKLLKTTLDKPAYKDAVEFYPEQKDIVLEGYTLTDKYVIIQYKKDVISYAKIFDYNGKFIRDLTPPEFSDIAGISYDKHSKYINVSLVSFAQPSKLFRLKEDKLDWEFVYQDNVPIDTKDIEFEQVFYKSKDGTKIPMFIVHKKGLKLDGNNPTLLYGYGGFNISMSPNFIGTTSSFINRGGVYAIANLRGGNEYGEDWHRGGMLERKQNVFDDFIAAAEYLINQKYTNPKKLAIKGGSNGGLLTGAVTMQRPDLFKAVVCAVPLLDMLRYHKFLIARYWIPEYGDPDNPKDFEYIWKYSPYHNIRMGFNYPSMLIKAGENDARVDPLHAKKMAAALQNLPSQTNPILLFVDFDSGHGSGQSTSQMVENIELEWQYVMGELEIK